jgi:GNAT superfamily N-acetyltransferase
MPPAASGFIEATATYLEMCAPPGRPPVPPPAPDLAVVRENRPSVPLYRRLYEAVGGPWGWTERSALSDRQLAAIIADPLVEVHVLWRAGVPVGFAELDRRRPPEIALAYLGLVPEVIGRGLGRFLIDRAVAAAWRHDPKRLWLHTCTLDHPRALDLYLEAGFRPFLRRVERVALPATAMPTRRKA